MATQGAFCLSLNAFLPRVQYGALNIAHIIYSVKARREETDVYLVENQI